MATFSEVEDLRDWFIDSCAEMLARLDVLNGEEPPVIMADLDKLAENITVIVREIVKSLDAILIEKKRKE